MAPPKDVDWEAIETEYRAGQLSVSEIARQYGLSHTAINKRAKTQGWTRDLTAKVRQEVSARLVSAEVSNLNARETIQVAAERGVSIVLSHRKDIGQLRALSSILAGRLSQVLDGTQPEGVCVGEKESVGDLLEKLTRINAKLVPLERQAFNLDASASEEARRTDAGTQERQRELLDSLKRIARVPQPGDAAKVINGHAVEVAR